MADIYECSHCGERVSGKKEYCETCKTAKGRAEIDEANFKIRQENKLKGHNV